MTDQEIISVENPTTLGQKEYNRYKELIKRSQEIYALNSKIDPELEELKRQAEIIAVTAKSRIDNLEMMKATIEADKLFDDYTVAYNKNIERNKKAEENRQAKAEAAAKEKESESKIITLDGSILTV